MSAELTLRLASVPNLRDVGGLATADGRLVRTGLLYRSTVLDRLTDADSVELSALGIRTIYDFRTGVERAAVQDRVLPETDYVLVDVLSDQTDNTPADIMASMNDPEVASVFFGGGKGAAMFVRQYRDFVTLGSARRSFGRMFRDLADERRRPALMHCSTGKDRTGWAAASLQLFLGVPMDLVVDDYLASNGHLRPALQHVLDEFAARGGDPMLLDEFFGVRPDYLESALAEVRSSFGTIERYFTDGLGLDDPTAGALRKAFLA
jgi:protein-tyrosine phosphatase